MSAAVAVTKVSEVDEPDEKELLRFVAVGSVDDGKSTLIGRLLHDAHGVYEDQLRSVKRASQMAGAEIDFSLFTDGLKAEREQGITIDVAYRYFATAKRKFIIADTPGHVQYTRNMATGASTASVAIILIDARLGVLQQSRRHAFIASLLGIPHLVVGVNKMDLVGYAEETFEAVKREFSAFAGKLGFKDVSFIPMSALRGDNVVARSDKMRFYRGPTVLELLESVPIGDDRNLADFRFPVQTVLRPNLDYRGYAAQIASGVVKKGDSITVLPSKKTSQVVGIDAWGQSLDEAFAPMSVTLRLADEIDVSRGDMIVHPTNLPRVDRRFDAMVVWLHERPLDRAKSYLLKHTTQTVRAQVESVGYQVNLETLEHAPAEKLALNDIGRLSITTHRPLFTDPYATNRSTGAFILIDSLTNDTVAAGMILDGREKRDVDDGSAGRDFEHTLVSPTERRQRFGHRGAAVVLKGADRARAFGLERALFDRGAAAVVVEGAREAVACVRAGLVAVCLVDAGGARAITEGLEARSLVTPNDTDSEEAIVKALESGGTFD
ncbi:MAG TPA: sulfate adenylyltransferase subunit CysN [Polyangiaceae bacterium]|jgi:sulfate adenylyltransferase large subunit